MIELPRLQPKRQPAIIKVLGLGGAGSNAIDRLILDGYEAASVIALNTDVQSLTGSVAGQKVHLGTQTTRGLGAGGDPEIGYSATEEAMTEIQSALSGAEMIFLCVGLGGGTGSGGAPLIASMAKAEGAVVIAFVTMPFSFEGKRRCAQAEDALVQIREHADVVICFQNDRLGEAASPNAGIQQAFVAADQILSRSILSITALVQRSGLIPIGLDELRGALASNQGSCLFGTGESESGNRAHEALERALKNPLMDRGRMLSEARDVLVHIAGGADLTLNEVTVVMEEFNRYISGATHLHFGVSVDPKLGKRFVFTVLTSIGGSAPREQHLPAAKKIEPVENREVEISEESQPEPIESSREKAVLVDHSSPVDEKEEEDVQLKPRMEIPATDFSLEADAPRKTVLRTKGPTGETIVDPDAVRLVVSKPAPAKKSKEKAEQMQFEQVNRGRFEKIEPTIVDGQDLDVPTFMRRNHKLK